MPSFAKAILTDSGFWYALYDSRDQYHAQALQLEGVLRNSTLLIPWPCLYETFNTRFARNTGAVQRFAALLRQANVILLRDDPYREAALEAAIAGVTSRSMALVDMVIRLILDDVNVRKHGLLTFNPGTSAISVGNIESKCCKVERLRARAVGFINQWPDI